MYTVRVVVWSSCLRIVLRHNAKTQYSLQYMAEIKKDTFVLCCLSCVVLCCLVLCCLVLSCVVSSCPVWSCVVWSCVVLCCLVLSCLIQHLFDTPVLTSNPIGQSSPPLGPRFSLSLLIPISNIHFNETSSPHVIHQILSSSIQLALSSLLLFLLLVFSISIFILFFACIFTFTLTFVFLLVPIMFTPQPIDWTWRECWTSKAQ